MSRGNLAEVWECPGTSWRFLNLKEGRDRDGVGRFLHQGTENTGRARGFAAVLFLPCEAGLVRV